MRTETAFSMDTSSIKYGPGVTREVGWDMEEQGARRVMVVTDPNLSDKEPVAVTLEALGNHSIDAVLYDQARVEPTDISGVAPEDAGEVLSSTIVEMMRTVGMPNGLGAVGYGPDDVDKLVD